MQNQIWQILTKPISEKEEDARREYMTRVIFILVSGGLALMSIFVLIFNFSVGEPDNAGTITILVTDGLMGAGWYLIFRGRWTFSRYLLPAIFLGLGGYFIFSGGLITTGVLQLAIAVILTAQLLGNKVQWATVAISITVYLVLGWIAGERDFEAFFTAGIVVGFSLSGVALLQWFSFTLLNSSMEKLRQAEQTARASEEKIRAIFESINDSITITDIEGKITELNQATLNLHDYKHREELIGNSAFKLIAKQDHPAARKNMQLTLLHGASNILDYKLVKKNGEEFNGELRAVLIKDEAGNPTGFVALTRDITNRKQADVERKRTERALKLSEEKFSKAFNTTPVLMTIEDDQNTIVDVNKAFLEAFGLEYEDVLGNRVSELNILYDSDELIALREENRKKGFLKDFEIRMRKKSGEIGILLLSSDNFHMEDIEHTLTSGLDITERKQAETEREKLISELQIKNDELERFTYTVSHDLKAPLITIGGFLGYLEDDLKSGDTDRVSQDIHRIADAVKKMNRLLNELLELSRIGRMMTPPENTPFEEIVQEALEKVQAQLTSKNITVEVKSNLPVVNGDRIRLVEVVQNLVDNAAKYIGEQPDPKIEIGVRNTDGKRIFFVKDNGIGIDPQFHDKVFGLFDKLDPSSKGTGIGLALVKRIVEVHGGRIWVESEPRKGATFCFTLSQQASTER
jgi:PAS domain S-box-containing protein